MFLPNLQPLDLHGCRGGFSISFQNRHAIFILTEKARSKATIELSEDGKLVEVQGPGNSQNEAVTKAEKIFKKQVLK